MATWTNEDGLLLRFGVDRAAERVDGIAQRKVQQLVVDLPSAAALADTDTAAVAGDVTFIPAGANILSAVFVVDTAFTSSGGGTLDIGLKQAAGTNIDDDGIDSAVAVAALGARQGVLCDGAMIGDKLEFDSYVMFTYDTAVFQTGAGRLIIEFMVD